MMCFKRKDMIATKGGPGGTQYWRINRIDFLSDLKQMILVRSYKVSSWKGDVLGQWRVLHGYDSWARSYQKGWHILPMFFDIFAIFLPDALRYVTGVLTNFTTSLSCLLPFFAFLALGIKDEMTVQVWDMQAFSWCCSAKAALTP